ncbi:LuxR C-terminal-related transcriptional regulator [Miltoncostaea marina]|uniref:LuxR C-terminal-related transcriptional regulator n=1 Tax=Miltoncostaea marina TaxID=2843215 RepID=UPI001C3D1D29|nr:LuxR C-terminal-related transcriptional regulator [Miltoncostaea marina]
MDAPATPLLRTKLRAPAPRPGAVARPRLAARVAGDDAAALTLVSAPAGFGKTTLVADALAGRPGVAWLSLDPRDDDPATFWRYVVAALETVRPGAGDGARALLDSSRPSSEVLVASLLNALDAPGDEVVLVLDDYHTVASPEIHDAVGMLVERRPPGVRLVITTRADPPLPLAALRARGALAELRASDLRFTADEAAAYLTGTMGLALGAGDVAALGERTEGWIAALQLAALSMRGRDDPSAFVADFAGDDRFVLDYLAGEVLERQPDDVRGFLLRTSILARLTGPLCDAVTGGGGGAAMLARLERANLFLVPLDDRRRWYRYHHLFADVLQVRLLDELPGEVAALHRRAGAWAEAAGDLPEAIRHALAAGDAGRAAALVERAAPAMRRARREATLGRWIDALPAELLRTRPVLATALVGTRMATGRFDGVAALLDAVEQRLAGPPEALVADDEEELRLLPAQVAIFRAALALVAGEGAATLGHAARALELAGPADHLPRGSAAALAGLAHWAAGDLVPAHERYAEAIGHLERAGHVSDALGCSLALADIQTAQGRLGAALATLEAGLAMAAPHGAIRGVADMHTGIAEVLVARGDPAGAAGRLTAAEALGEHAGLPQHPYRSRVAAARLRELEGDHAAALALLEEAGRRFDTDFSPVVRPVPAIAARVRLRAGDLAGAARWARERGLGTDEEPADATEYERVTLARLLVRRGDEGALPLVARLLAAAERGGREGTVVELLALRALAELAGGDERAARASLEEALVRAEPEGWARPILDAGPGVADILRAIAAAGRAREPARRVLAALTAEDRRPPAAAGPAEGLSEREREVLRLLGSDLSGPDIARELVVSLNTLRTHTKHIYAKLGVTSRRAAVRRAAELDL